MTAIAIIAASALLAALAFRAFYISAMLPPGESRLQMAMRRSGSSAE